MTDSAASLHLDGVGKYFVEGGDWAVRDLDIEVHPGEFFGLLGPSGCGKTTTLNIIAGFLAPNEGAVHVNGQDMTRVPPHTRGTSMVFQDYALFPHMSARDNVEFGMKVQGMPADERRRKSDHLLELVDLAARADHMPAQLSGGQQQRVAVARALSVDPDIVLLDEPLSNLDTRLRTDVRNELASMFRNAGVTVILVTHDQGEAFAFCDRVAVLLRGKLQAVDEPTELYSRPPSIEVAEFLGDANFYPAKLSDAAATASTPDARVEFGATTLVCSVTCTSSLDVDDLDVDGHVMVRPESVLVSTDAREPARDVVNVGEGTVAAAEFLGDTVTYDVRANGGTTIRVKAPFTGHVHEAGAEVHVWWRRGAVHFVDR